MAVEISQFISEIVSVTVRPQIADLYQPAFLVDISWAVFAAKFNLHQGPIACKSKSRMYNKNILTVAKWRSPDRKRAAIYTFYNELDND